MDRDAIARAVRRREAEDALAAERDRADSLREEIGRLVTALEGARVDETAYSLMSPEDAALVRGVIEPPPVPEPDTEEDETWAFFKDGLGAAELPDPRTEAEEEIARLEQEIAECARLQAALERYIDALGRMDLAVAWEGLEPAPRGSGTVRLICIRMDEGEHDLPDRAAVSVEDGLVGDRWARGRRDPDAQITLMNARVAELVARNGTPAHMAGDNFQVDLDLSEEALPVGTRLRLGEALLEVSPAPHTGCKKFKERFGLEALTWVNDHRHLRLRGVNCRVVEGGTVGIGDTVAVV